MLNVIAGIAWDPQIRGFLATAVGVVVLMGSVYLLLLTNLGHRLGFLLASTAFFGWCLLMGITWWAYGTIGMLGAAPSWHVKEVVFSEDGTEAALDEADLEDAHSITVDGLLPIEELNELDAAALADYSGEVQDELGGWKFLPESNPSYGEAKATVDAYFSEEGLAALEIEGPDDYIASYSFERGGKMDLPADPSRLDRIGHQFLTTFWQVKHPPRYAVIQVQRVVEQEAGPGEAPPTPEADESTPVVSVILERDLGDVRFPGAMLTIFSGIMFAVTLSMLHRRDLRAAEARGIDTGRPAV